MEGEGVGAVIVKKKTLKVLGRCDSLRYVSSFLLITSLIQLNYLIIAL